MPKGRRRSGSLARSSGKPVKLTAFNSLAVSHMTDAPHCESEQSRGSLMVQHQHDGAILTSLQPKLVGYCSIMLSPNLNKTTNHDNSYRYPGSGIVRHPSMILHARHFEAGSTCCTMASLMWQVRWVFMIFSPFFSPHASHLTSPHPQYLVRAYHNIISCSIKLGRSLLPH